MESPRKIFIHLRLLKQFHINSNQVESSLLFFLTQGVIGMTPLKTVLGIVLIVCLTIVIFTFINRGKLCELSIKSGRQEVAAKLACIP